jgi:hypothetical protein
MSVHGSRRASVRALVAISVVAMLAVGASPVAAAQRYLELTSVGPSGPSGPGFENNVLASADGSRIFFTTTDSLDSLDTDAKADLYERDGSQTTLLSRGPSGGNGTFDVSNVVVTPDGSRAYFTTKEGLCCGDIDSTEDVYENAGGVLSLASVEAPGGTSFTGANLLTALGTSADGTRMFFEWRKPTTASLHEIYERANGQTTLLFGQPPSSFSPISASAAPRQMVPASGH